MPLSRSLTQPSGTIEYMVSASDTLNSVAAKFQTTPTELGRINRITGRVIFPGQVLFVPKRHSSTSVSTSGDITSSGSISGRGSSFTTDEDVPPNTPNTLHSGSETSLVLSSTGSIIVDNNNPVPGQAMRIGKQNEQSLELDHPLFPHHMNLSATASLPVVTSTFNTNNINSSQNDPQTGQQASATMATSHTPQIDPADRECLERFLKINVRYITDGQGVVPGVLLITPNALMFDPYVSDPLVMERGREFYGVTVPIELVLKTAMYSDIAHMRVKHAIDAVPNVPKPSVYYAEKDENDDGQSSGIVDEDVLKSVTGKHFDTIAINQRDSTQSSVPSQQSIDSESSLVKPDDNRHPLTVCAEEGADDICPVSVVVASDGEKQSTQQTHACDDNLDQKITIRDENGSSQDEAEPPTSEDVKDPMLSQQDTKPLLARVESAHEAIEDEQQQQQKQQQQQQQLPQPPAQLGMAHEVSIDLSDTTTEQSFNMNVSTDDECKQQQSQHSQNRLSSYFQTKLALAERHSAPLSPQQPQRETPPPLVTAISADSDPQSSLDSANGKRRSAAGESRREQMLKRLSNPVDKIGNMTKSGFNSSINATKSGISATKTGITSGIMATKSGLTTGLSVTKTGFNKVLSTPKNLMDFSSGLVRDARGALATGSKSENDLSEHLSLPNSGSNTSKDLPSNKRSESSLGYTNMADAKNEVFENFDKLIPKSSGGSNSSRQQHSGASKDPPLYLCIRMGKFSKKIKKHRFVPAFSFGKKKYEREYWFSIPREKAKNLYYFFHKWAPEVYGDVEDLKGIEARQLEPINTDDEMISDESDEEVDDPLLVGGSSTDGQNKGATGDDAESGENKPKFWRRRGPLNFLKLVEDHFSTEGMSADWNISNSSEDHSFLERFGAEPTEPILPDIIGQSELLNTDIIRNLSKHLPARAEGYAWTVIYSTSQHGFSLNSLYREMKRIDTPVLLLIEDTNEAKFGALLSNTIQMSDHFYGTGETFLFTFCPEFACYPWTGENLFFIKGNNDSISIGAGEGNFGLWLDGDLYHGSSHPCKTFGNSTLSSEEDFVVKSIECWTFV